MSSDRKIEAFLSHSSHDAEFANFLAAQIEAAFNNILHVFVASRPDELKSNAKWREDIMAALDKAEYLFVLLTSTSENSSWVSFELGYFWRKYQGKNTHILRHPDANIPGPLAEIQAKLVTSSDEVTSFFNTLSQSVGIEAKPDILAINERAKIIQGRIPERSLKYFEKMLSHHAWEYLGEIERTPSAGEIMDMIEQGSRFRVATHNEVWTCTDDVALQIIRDYSTKEDFMEDWIKKLSAYLNRDDFAYKYSVYLTITGVPIKKLIFISIDEGRYFAPLPEMRSDSSDDLTDDTAITFYWKRDSYEYKVGMTIGKFHKYKSPEEFAQATGIIIE